MAMNIIIYEETEDETITRKADAKYGLVWNIMSHIEGSTSTFPWLCSIKEYGTTIFNDSLVPVLLRELGELKNKVTSQSVLTEIDRTANFLQLKQMGTLIKFTSA